MKIYCQYTFCTKICIMHELFRLDYFSLFLQRSIPDMLMKSTHAAPQVTTQLLRMIRVINPTWITRFTPWCNMTWCNNIIHGCSCTNNGNNNTHYA